MTLGFVVLAFALAFWQRPGWAMTDTKIDLHVDPARFLRQAASVWTSTTDLGEVHSVQYSGYVWPMGPFFSAGHALGLSPWVVQRIWLALILAACAWGVLKLLDVLVGRPRGIVHLVAAAFFVLNPYTVLFTGRTTVTLVGYAALPWLLLVVHQGMRATRGWRGWRSWWWAAAFALILTSIEGGVNGAVVGWMLVGPLVLLLYEPTIGAVRWRDSAGFLARVGVLGILASLWWIAPLLVHVRYGIDFLQFTEQPRSIWNTNSVTEALRLMAYWTSYIDFGFYGVKRPLYPGSPTMLFNPLVVGASLILPGLAVAGFVLARRHRYATLLLLLVLVGVIIEVAGFPEGTPARDAMEYVYRRSFVLRFMRTTQKAAPLVALGLAGLLGLGARVAWLRLHAAPRRGVTRAALVAAPAALALLIALAALPLIRGTGPDRQVTWKRIAPAWTQAGADLDRDLAPNTRAMVLPGQIFAYYRWGATIDAILPRVTERPVAVRYETPYSDLHAVDLLTTVDNLVQQRRLLPGQLRPLLRLMGVGAVVNGTDDDITRSGAVDPSIATAELRGQGLGPSRPYGPSRTVPPATGEIEGAVRVPQVRRYDVRGARGMVHVDPSGPATIVDGGAGGLAALAAFGQLPARAPIRYAGDVTPGALRREATRGGEVVVTDSNRRRAFVPEYTQQNLGPTLGAVEQPDVNSAVVNPFPGRGSDAQTVSVTQGVSYLRAPGTGRAVAFPERAPISAFDGDPSTAWVPYRYLAPRDRWIEAGFTRPRDVPHVDVRPLSGVPARVTEIDVNGIKAHVGRGVTRVPVNLHGVSSIRVRIDHVIRPPGRNQGPGGLREIAIPGLRVRQLLRTPVLTAKALAGRDLDRVGLTYLFERTTGDQPFQRDRFTESPMLDELRDRADAEAVMRRLVFAPAARSYAVDAWLHPAVTAPDSALDRLAGARGGARFESSSRFHNQPRYRASRAFDKRDDTGWVGIWVRPDAPLPWIEWTAPHSLTVSTLRLTPSSLPVRRPTRVRLSWAGGETAPLRVAADGTVRLPSPVRAARVRMTVLAAAFPAGTSTAQRTARAVGIASLDVPGLPAAAVPTSGPLATSCRSVTAIVGGRRVGLRPAGTVSDLDAGRPVRARACGARVRLRKGVQKISAVGGTFSVDQLRLRSSAPVAAGPPAGGGRVVDAGRLGEHSVDDVRLHLAGPSWLVLGQSYDHGWRASCDGRSLGAPQVVDGYANGWRAPADCRRASFSFAPQDGVRTSYVVSAIVCALLALFVLVGGWRGRARPAGERRWTPLPEPPAQRLVLPRAAAVALPLTVALSLIFALRTSVVIFPVLILILWRGVSAVRLAAVAAGLLGVVVPLLYLAIAPSDEGGYNFNYSIDLLPAHWVGVGAMILLGLVAWRMLAAARSESRGTGPRSPDAGTHPPRSPDPGPERESSAVAIAGRS
jgi:arabinofuranan 3-O-arabinosyltransferase